MEQSDIKSPVQLNNKPIFLQRLPLALLHAYTCPKLVSKAFDQLEVDRRQRQRMKEGNPSSLPLWTAPAARIWLHGSRKERPVLQSQKQLVS